MFIFFKYYKKFRNYRACAIDFGFEYIASLFSPFYSFNTDNFISSIKCVALLPSSIEKRGGGSLGDVVFCSKYPLGFLLLFFLNLIKIVNTITKITIAKTNRANPPMVPPIIAPFESLLLGLEQVIIRKLHGSSE